MIRKSKFVEYIDRFLHGEMNKDEAVRFREEMDAAPELREELELHREVEDAVKEKDIMALRDMLHELETPPPKVEPVVADKQQFSFSLKEELSSFRMMTHPVSVHDMKTIDEGLPILHLVQHHIAEKENLHELYREIFEDESDDSLISAADQMILDDIEDALDEKDVMDLRANLKQIADNIPAHPYSAEDIDRYLEGDLSDIELSEFNEELEHNSGLEKDILLYRETDLAMAETDIAELRAALSEIAGRETSTSRKKNDIDRYLQKELSEHELAAFESEMESNPDLVAEVNLYQDVNAAIREEDIMSLRARMEGINNDIINDKRRERSFATRIPRKKAIAVSAAASLTLLLGINGMMKQAGNTDVLELYNKYYSVYPGAGLSRAGGTSLDKDISQALLLFNEKNYDQSILLFGKTLEEDPGNPVANFYTAQAYQETGKYSKAIAYYQLVIQTGNNLFIDQAEWYTGLCYLQNDDRKNAVRKFKTIVDAKSYYSEKASAILRKLRYTEK